MKKEWALPRLAQVLRTEWIAMRSGTSDSVVARTGAACDGGFADAGGAAETGLDGFGGEDGVEALQSMVRPGECHELD